MEALDGIGRSLFVQGAAMTGRKPRLLHIAGLEGDGEVERLFQLYAGRIREDCPHEDLLLVAQGRIHPRLLDGIQSGIRTIELAGWWRGLAVPRGLRGLRLRRAVRALAPRIGVIWDRLGDLPAARALRARGASVVHYEGGSCASAERTPASLEYVELLEHVVCDGPETAALLEEEWGYRGSIDVVAARPHPGEADERAAGELSPEELVEQLRTGFTRPFGA